MGLPLSIVYTITDLYSTVAQTCPECMVSLCHPASRSSLWAGLTGNGKENWCGTGFERCLACPLLCLGEAVRSL